MRITLQVSKGLTLGMNTSVRRHYSPKSEKFCIYRGTFPIFGNQFRNRMIKHAVNLLVLNPIPYISRLFADVEKDTLLWIILVQSVLLLFVFGYHLVRFLKKKYPMGIGRMFRSVKLQVTLEKDRPLRPKLLSMTIENTGKNDAEINSPVLEFRKIWSKRKFKLSGISGQQVYPMYIQSGNAHHLRIETSTFHLYDRSIKSYYWARIYVSDVEGRKWKSNKIKLRKSLVT